MKELRRLTLHIVLLVIAAFAGVLTRWLVRFWRHRRSR